MTQKRILIVDDDPDILHFLKKELESLHYKCECSTSVEDALAMVKVLPPDLVLLDLGFHRAGGSAFIQNLKTWLGPDIKAPPVIVLSGHKDKEIIDYAMDLGAAGFIAKPYDVNNLVSMVNEYI